MQYIMFFVQNKSVFLSLDFDWNMTVFLRDEIHVSLVNEESISVSAKSVLFYFALL